MTCPHCQSEFGYIITDAQEIPAFDAPILCQHCVQVSLLSRGTVRALTDLELAMVKASPSWEAVIVPAQVILMAQRRQRAAMNN